MRGGRQSTPCTIQSPFSAQWQETGFWNAFPRFSNVSASFAFVGDVVIAEPKALVGFAGQRVIKNTVREELPEGFQRAEFLMQKGAIDMIIDRRQLRATIARQLAMLQRQSADAVA